MLIQNITTYLIHYFYNLKSRCDHEKKILNRILHTNIHVLKKKNTFLGGWGFGNGKVLPINMFVY